MNKETLKEAINSWTTSLKDKSKSQWSDRDHAIWDFLAPSHMKYAFMFEITLEGLAWATDGEGNGWTYDLTQDENLERIIKNLKLLNSEDN